MADAARHEWAVPGALVHVDTKALGRIAGIGHRIHGDRITRVRGIGWEHIHVCKDAVAFLARAGAWFGARGVRIER